MLNAASSPDTPRADDAPVPVACGLPELRRHPIRHPDDYDIALPEWLKQCIANVPPGIGQSCPTDPEALLVSAFDFGFQLHEGQFRASGDPYIVHPVAVADLLRDIGASASVIAAGFLHDVVEDTDVTPSRFRSTSGARSGNWWKGSPSLVGFTSTTALKRRRKTCERCFWQWPATSGWCW